MDTDNIIIYEKDFLAAQKICASIDDTDRRNKAVANVLAAQIAASYFDTSTYDVDIQSSLHNIAPVSENFDIADLYVNEAYIDVRAYFSDEEMCVPKVHYDTGILPVAYMFVKFSSDLKNATVTGFLYPESVNRSNLVEDVYPVSLNELSNFYDIEMRLHKQSAQSFVDDIKLYELLEGSLADKEVIEVFKVLVTSKYLRTKLVKSVKAQSAFNFVSTPERKAIGGDENTNSEEFPVLEYADEADDAGKDIVEIDTNSEAPEEQATQEESPVDNEEDDDYDLTDEDLDSLFVGEESTPVDNQAQNYVTEITPSGASVIQSLDNEEMPQDENIKENEEQIETLFNGEQQGVPVGKKKKSALLPILILILLICGGGYFWYTQLFNQSSNDDYLSSQPAVSDIDTDEQETAEVENKEEQLDAMPVETVESSPVVNKEESNSTAIPAIERNLDASVLVSNLKIDWEVPGGYAANTAAKRYLVKLGKVIQLDLKTELLLLSKPPLSNKITVELQFNQNIGKFEVVGIQMSSGEKTVDDKVLQTVKNALSYSLSTNMETFGKLQGNPVLIINL